MDKSGELPADNGQIDWDQTVQWLDLGGMRIASWSFGREGDPRLLFVHGLGNSGSIWQAVLRDTMRGFQCTVIDLPHFGMSEASSPLSFQLLVDAVREVSENVTAASVIVGHSIGGLAAVVAASELEKATGSRPKVLAINSTLDPVARMARGDLWRLAERPLQALALVETGVELLARVTPGQFVTVAHLPVISKVLLYPFLVHPERVSRDDLLAAARGLDFGLAPWTGSRLISDGVRAVRTASVDRSVTFLNGRSDPLVSGFAPDLYGQDGGHARWVSAAGAHWLMVESPKTVIAEIERSRA